MSTSDLVAGQNVMYRLRSVMAITAMSRSLIYREMRAGTFPQPVLLAPRTVAWRKSDLDKWMAQRPAVQRHKQSA